MPHLRLNISSAQELFRPQRVAQRIVDSESYGTPVTDIYFPEATRSYWDEVTVPVEEFKTRTKPVAVVLRGAPGVSVPGDSGQFAIYKPQPVKTVDGITAEEYNDRRLVSRDSLQSIADRLMDRHINIHRKTREALCLEAITTGAVNFPIAGAQGQIIGIYHFVYGTLDTAWEPSANWLSDAVGLDVVVSDLSALRRHRARRGKATDRIDVGPAVFAALAKKVMGLNNETRVAASVSGPGTLNIAGYTIYEQAEEVEHPGAPDLGQPGGAVAAGFKKIVEDDGIMATGNNDGRRLLNVKKDNFKIGDSEVPVGFVLAEAKDGSAIDVFAESKPFPIVDPSAITRASANPA
jgi:hypothetical protein